MFCAVGGLRRSKRLSQQPPAPTHQAYAPFNRTTFVLFALKRTCFVLSAGSGALSGSANRLSRLRTKLTPRSTAQLLCSSHSSAHVLCCRRAPGALSGSANSPPRLRTKLTPRSTAQLLCSLRSTAHILCCRRAPGALSGSANSPPRLRTKLTPRSTAQLLCFSRSTAHVLCCRRAPGAAAGKEKPRSDGSGPVSYCLFTHRWSDAARTSAPPLSRCSVCPRQGRRRRRGGGTTSIRPDARTNRE